MLEPFIPFHLHQYLVLEPCTHYPLPALRPCNWCTVHCAGALYLVPSAKAMYLVLVPCTQCCCPVPQCLCPIPGTGALYLVPSAKALYPVQVSCSLSQGRGTGAPYPTPGTGANAGARRPVLLPCTAAPRPARSARCRCPVYSVWCRCPVPGAYTGNGCQRWLLMPVPRCRFQCRCPGRVCSSRSRWTVHGAGCLCRCPVPVVPSGRPRPARRPPRPGPPPPPPAAISANPGGGARPCRSAAAAPGRRPAPQPW